MTSSAAPSPSRVEQAIGSTILEQKRTQPESHRGDEGRDQPVRVLGLLSIDHLGDELALAKRPIRTSQPGLRRAPPARPRSEVERWRAQSRPQNDEAHL